jgi:hypothetical protein
MNNIGDAMLEKITEYTLPTYDDVFMHLASLSLPLSVSELHGLLCGYICSGKYSQAESYLRTLMASFNHQDAKAASALLFTCFYVSQHQMETFDFSFQLLMPDDDAALIKRAEGFSDWCEGFTQGLTLSNIGFEHFSDDESKTALSHIEEFAQLDSDGLLIDEDDEVALMEVQEFTRMAVLRLYSDLNVLPPVSLMRFQHQI